MKTTRLLILFFLTSCTSARYTATPVRMDVTGKGIKVTPMGKPIEVKDTVIYGALIKRIQ